MPAENPPAVLRVVAVLRNGHNNPDGSSVRGVKLLTDQGIRELWEDHEGEKLAVDTFIRVFYRGRNRLTNSTS